MVAGVGRRERGAPMFAASRGDSQTVGAGQYFVELRLTARTRIVLMASWSSSVYPIMAVSRIGEIQSWIGSRKEDQEGRRRRVEGRKRGLSFDCGDGVELGPPSRHAGLTCP